MGLDDCLESGLLLRDSVLDTVTGVGTGKLRDSYDAIVKGGGRFYLSGMSSQARGLVEADIKGKPAEFAQPTVLVRLSLEHDRMFTALFRLLPLLFEEQWRTGDAGRAAAAGRRRGGLRRCACANRHQKRRQ